MREHANRIRNALSFETTVIGAGLLLVAALIVGLAFMGGQTSKILSTVGAAVDNSNAGTPVDTGDAGSGSGSDATNGSGNGTRSGSGSGSGSGSSAAEAVAVQTLLIVRTGDLTIEVSDLAAAVRDGEAAVSRAGGYIAASTQSGTDKTATSVVTYRIPSGAWETTLGALHALAARILSEHVKTDEVSGQVVDLTARIANLRATEAALQAIMARATKISDVLDVQDQLTTTRGEIEKLVGDKAQLQDQAAYGSLAVTYRLPDVPKPTATPLPAKGWDPGNDVAQAGGKLVRIGQTTTSIGIWLAIVGLPIVIGGLVTLFAAWQVYRLGRWVIRRRGEIGAGS